MLALIATVALAVGSPGPGAQPAQVLVTLNGGDYQPGDQVRVEIEPGEDGYLIVFRVDGDGYLRVLFPLDPDLDPFVRGGGRYELRGRGEKGSFLADDRGGTGLIFAALSREPLAFDQYAAGSHWDYERLWLPDPAGDAEAQLMTIVRAMSDNGRFDYDAAGYRVWGPGFQAEPTVAIAGGYSEPYYDSYYDPYYGSGFGCLACSWGSRSGISISIGNRYGGFGTYGYRSNWYDPFRYDRYDYYGLDYGYGSNRWNGWFGWDSWYGTPYRPYTVINVPPRPIVVDSRTGLRSRPRQPSLGGLTSQPRIETTVGDRSPRATGQRPIADTDNGTRSRPGSAASTPRSGARPATTSTPRTTTSSPSPRTAAPTRSRGRPGGDATGDTRASTVQPPSAADRPVYRPPTSVSRRPSASPTAAAPAARRPASSSRLGGDDVRARTGSSAPKAASPSSSSGRTIQPRTASAPTRSSVAPPRSSSASPRRSSAPPSRASAPPRSSSASPRRSSAPPSRASAPPRSSSAPARSSSPRTSSAPPRTSSAPARSSSPRTSSAPARSSSPRTSSAPARSSSPASSGKSTGSSRPRGNS